MALKSIMPHLNVRSIEDAVAYYRDVLDFEVPFTMPGPEGRLVHAEVRSGDVTLMFGSDEEIPEAAKPFLGTGTTLYLDMGETDIDTYYAEVQARGGQVVHCIADQFWGDRTFTVQDPNGYLLMFSRHVRDVDPEQLAAVAGNGHDA